MRWKTAVLVSGLVAVIAAFIYPRPPRVGSAPPQISGLRPITTVCSELGVQYPPRNIFLRAFKQERELELWATGKDGRMRLLRTYPIAAASGIPGPKRREGDLQVPEGVYHVARFNPQSQFHLSLGLNYPNKSDRILGDPRRPGSDIYIHGNQVSIGCLAMTDEKIEEIYFLATKARPKIPVHIFPCRMHGETYKSLTRAYPQHERLWSQLAGVYMAFQTTRRLPKVVIDSKGNYVVERSDG